MNDKFVLKSKTIIGALIAAVPALFLLSGQAAPAADKLAQAQGALEALVVALVGLAGAVLAIIGRVKAESTLTIRPSGRPSRRIGLVLVVALVPVLLLAACTTPKLSDDPQIAMEQEWVAACEQMKSGVATALALRKAGALNPDEILTMGLIKTVYVGTCTGEPQPVGAALSEGAVKGAVFSLCPELVWVDDITVTITLAAVCASRQYLLHELENTT